MKVTVMTAASKFTKCAQFNVLKKKKKTASTKYYQQGLNFITQEMLPKIKSLPFE